ncbi:MAG: hypothetical protein CMM77_11945 [Rhodospirillaceae bacterium]|nr:hypothetical protein [Magnetovibrio sp.]MAY67828.1 hypothetical protein [Rhodospirillaceae bacterium]
MTAISIPFANSYAALPDRFFVRQAPDPVRAPALIRLNRPLCDLLGLDADALSSDEGAAIFAGNAVPEGAEPIAQAYAGHQFGGWVPQLGDGRAVLLGEVVGTDGLRRDVQLKGSGRTPFSRGGDGRAALGPVLREYVVSEAMHALGVPTTRALAAVTTGQDVIREGYLPGAVLTRVAQSHVRVGTFQYFAARRDEEALRTLADYVIDRHYPEAARADNPYTALLAAVVARQAGLVAKWFGLGFIHGVMNTDNTSVAGETIDYGPCAFMDIYHPGTVFSSIDHGGRYAFANQPSILQWNLAQLAQCLMPLIDPDGDKALALAQAEVDAYPAAFEAALIAEFRAKLGLATAQDDDLSLATDLLACMAEGEADFTNTFRYLANRIEADPADDTDPASLFNNPDAFEAWAARWRARLSEDGRAADACAAALRDKNPAVIPRNHLVEAAIRAAEDNGDFAPFNALVEEVLRPYATRPAGSRYVRPPAPDEVVQQTFCGT